MGLTELGGGKIVLSNYTVNRWFPPCHTLRTLVLASSECILDNLGDFARAVPNLHDFVSHLSMPNFSSDVLKYLPADLRRAFFISYDDFDLEDDNKMRHLTFRKPAKLELCSLVKLRSPSRSLPASEMANFETLCAPLVAAFTEEGAEFRYKLSSRPAEEELADVMGALGL